MKEQMNSTARVGAAPMGNGVLVSIFVPDDHPLLQLMRALDWKAITGVMVKYWRKAGKNVDGGPGRPEGDGVAQSEQADARCGQSGERSANGDGLKQGKWQAEGRKKDRDKGEAYP